MGIYNEDRNNGTTTTLSCCAMKHLCYFKEYVNLFCVSNLHHTFLWNVLFVVFSLFSIIAAFMLILKGRHKLKDMMTLDETLPEKEI